jgi:hypothetical protein
LVFIEALWARNNYGEREGSEKSGRMEYAPTEITESQHI